MNYLMNNPNNF